MKRCPWAMVDDLYIKYHDEEWGVPVFDDNTQFEFLVLESAQAGLSWHTILKKREEYRIAYDNFDPGIVAFYDNKKLKELISNPGIIRNKLKIVASINNAQKFLKLQQQFGSFCNYIWKFVEGNPIINHWEEMNQVPANTPLSDIISKDLKQRGFKFLGSTIIYSHLQATGLVNDHLVSCFRWHECNI